MQLVLRGHKTKREADYGSKKIGYSLSQKKREKKGSKAQERPKSLSPRLCVGQLCTPRLAKRHNMFGQFMKEHSEVRTIWFPSVALTHDIIREIFSFYRWPMTAQIDNVYCRSVLLLVESLSPRLCVGQLCTPRLAKRHNMFGQFMKEHSEVRTIWFPSVACIDAWNHNRNFVFRVYRWLLIHRLIKLLIVLPEIDEKTLDLRA